MPKPLVAILGKSIKRVARLRGGGSALPGLVVEKIDPEFITRTLKQLPHGVAIISGTNGKTTTTKLVVSMLESQGLKVFTNRTGSNFTRGVAAALLDEIDVRGRMNADIAVLELDEAHAVHFANKIPPKHSLLLNVMRDQLDRFGEIDHTANLLRKVADQTTQTVVLNREDPRLANIAKSISPKQTVFFGLDKSLKKYFPSDGELLSKNAKSSSTGRQPSADVVLSNFNQSTATFSIDNKKTSVKLKLSGIYNTLNAAAALAFVRSIVGPQNIDQNKLIAALKNTAPAFGRGEILRVDGQELEIVLVKNPSGFQLGLSSFEPEHTATMIAINDNYADGRDMSWLWDVDFDSLKPGGVLQVSGIRAYDMALRLEHSDINVENVETDLKKALRQFIKNSPQNKKRIYCTYTAMLNLRKQLSKITKVEVIR